MTDRAGGAGGGEYRSPVALGMAADVPMILPLLRVERLGNETPAAGQRRAIEIDAVGRSQREYAANVY
jgi:hypothetical protein